MFYDSHCSSCSVDRCANNVFKGGPLDDLPFGMTQIFCLDCLSSVPFGQLILDKFVKSVASRCQILGQFCAKVNFRWGFASPTVGLLPTPIARFKGKGEETVG